MTFDLQNVKTRKRNTLKASVTTHFFVEVNTTVLENGGWRGGLGGGGEGRDLCYYFKEGHYEFVWRVVNVALYRVRKIDMWRKGLSVLPTRLLFVSISFRLSEDSSGMYMQTAIHSA